VILPERKGFFDLLFQNRDQDALAGLSVELRALARMACTLQGGTLLARLPFDLRIR
jgi:hypothetical protein